MAIITKIEGGGTAPVPRISFAEPAPLGPPAPVNYDRALPVWQVEDRRTYWQQIKQMQDEWDAQQRELQARQRAAYQYAGPTPPTVQPFPVDDLRQFQAQAGQPDFSVVPYQQAAQAGYGPDDLRLTQASSGQYGGPSPEFLAEQARLTALRNRPPADDRSILERAVGKGVEAVQRFTPIDETYRGLRTSNIVGEPLVEQATRFFQNAPMPIPVGGAVGGGTATTKPSEGTARTISEAFIPTEVWDTALTLVPAAKAKTVPELLAALTIGDVDAVRAVNQAKEIVGSPVARAFADEAGALKLPFVPKPRTQFSPAVETLLTRGSNSGIDQQLFNNAVQSASNVPNPNAWPLKSYFNRARSLWDSAVIRNPIVQQAHMAATRYGDAQYQRIQSITRGVDTAIRQAFENGNGIDQTLRAAYTGPRTPDLQPFIGTPWHFLDNPTLYPNATPMQKQLAQSWDDITRNELRFSQSVGIPASEWEDAWIKHTFKRPDKVPTTRPTGRKGAGLTQQRKLTTEEFVQFAKTNNLEVDTDVMAILNRRLAASARVRSNMVYLDAVAQATGGKRARAMPIKGQFAAQATPRGMTRIEQGGMTWFIPDDVAKSVLDTMSARSIPPDEKFAEEVLDVTRGTLLNLDFSAGLGRQFMLGFANDPVGASRAWGKGWQTFLTPEGWTEWYAQNAAKAEMWAQHSLQLRMSPLDIQSQLKGVKGNPLDAVPGVKQLNALQFEVILPIVKINTADRGYEMLKLQQRGGLGSFFKGLPFFDKLNSKLSKPLSRYTDDELMDIVGDVTNNWLGGIEWAKIGHSPGLLRKFLILTEGWTRAQMGVMINAPKLSPKGILARRMLAQELMMGAGASTIGSLLLTGQLPEYDPRKVRFLNLKTPFGDVPTMPHATLIRTVVQALAGKAPDDIFGDESFLGQRLNALLKFNEGRVGQIPRLGWELAQGQDYYGRDIDQYDAIPGLPARAEFILRELSPIISQGILQDLEDGRSPLEMGVRAGLEFGGFNLRPKTATQLVDEAVVGEKIPKTGGGFYEHYRDLPPDIRGEFDKRHLEDVQRLRDYRESRGRDTFDQLRAQTDAGLAALQPLADNDPEAYRRKAGEFVGDQALLIQEKLKELDLPEREGDLAILDGYFDAVEPATDPTTRDVDFDKRDVLVEDYRASLKPEEQQRLDEMLAYSRDPVYRQLKADKKLLDQAGYFDRRDSAFKLWLEEGNPPFPMPDEAKVSVDAFITWLKKDLAADGLGAENYTRHMNYRDFEKAYTFLNEGYLEGLGALEDLAIRWGYQETVHSEEAYDAYRARTGLEPKIPAR